MKFEKIISDYYKEQIDGVKTPPCPKEMYTVGNRAAQASGLSRILLAAMLALLFLPFIYNADQQSKLALKATEFSRKYNVKETIYEKVSELQEIASYSSISGGKK